MSRNQQQTLPTGRQGPTRGAGPQPTADDLAVRFSLSRPEDRRIMPVAFAVALCLHMLCMLISFPQSKLEAPPARTHDPIVIKRYVPPPPAPRRQHSASRHTESKRKLLVPDLTPDALEPIVEPSPEFALESLPSDGEFYVGAVEAPSGYGPGSPGGTGDGLLLAGVGGVTNPVRVEESYVRPEYPEMARAARVEGQVILKAVICHDGSVGMFEVLRCEPQGFGFAESATTAVGQWRYHPATQDGAPVDCYFTIVVDFDLV